jgi:hypothetical protein
MGGLYLGRVVIGDMMLTFLAPLASLRLIRRQDGFDEGRLLFQSLALLLHLFLGRTRLVGSEGSLGNMQLVPP